LLRVISSANNKAYVLKSIVPSEFQYQENLQQDLVACPNLRVVKDTIPEHLLFLYQYLTDNFLQLA
jgi:hypothetical protein